MFYVDKENLAKSAGLRRQFAIVANMRESNYNHETNLMEVNGLQTNDARIPGDTWRDFDRQAKTLMTGDEGGELLADLMPLARNVNIGKIVSNEKVVIMHRTGNMAAQAFVHAYSIDNGACTIAAAGDKVEKRESWIAKINARLKSVFNQSPVVPGEPSKGRKMEKEDIKQVMDAVGEVVANAIKPIAAKIDALEVNQKTIGEQLTANQRAQDAEKRKAVTEKFGEVVANSLEGAALDAMFAQCGDAAKIAANTGADKKKSGQDFETAID